MTRRARLVRWCRTRDESGQAGGIESIPFGILVFVVGALLVANAWGVIDAKMAVSAAAREGARTFVEAAVRNPSALQAAARASGTAAADDAVTAQGRGLSHFRIDFAIGGDGRYARCNVVTATAQYAVPVIHVPWLGSAGPSFFTARAKHSERIDPLRSGIPGEATCNENRQ